MRLQHQTTIEVHKIPSGITRYIGHYVFMAFGGKYVIIQFSAFHQNFLGCPM